MDIALSRDSGPLEPNRPPAPHAHVTVEPGGPDFAAAQAYAAPADDLADGAQRVPAFADGLADHRTVDSVRATAS